jgi:alpha-glucosidase
VLAFARGDDVLCVFNLSAATHAVRLEGAGETSIAEGAERRDEVLVLQPNGFAIMEIVSTPAIEDAPVPHSQAKNADGVIGAL